jgi:hypothetical protein
MSTRYSPKIVTDGLVAYWDAGNTKSYPGSGTQWIDVIGQNNLTNSGAVFNTDGYWTFDSAGANLESFENGISIPLSNAVTFATWYRRLGNGFGSPRLIETTIDGATSSSNSHGLFIDLNGSLRAWLDQSGTGSSRFFTLDDATTWTDTDWHYMVMTYDSPSAVLYMDGVAVETASVASTTVDDINNIIVGSIGSVGQTPTAHYFTGNIALCQIWNKGLTATEVLQNYNAMKNRFI